jgi:hypothetical protein
VKEGIVVSRFEAEKEWFLICSGRKGSMQGRKGSRRRKGFFYGFVQEENK